MLRRGIPTLVALLAAAALVVLGTARFKREAATYKPVVPPYDVFWCAADADCELVDRIGCCSCAEGGAQWAVSASKRDDLRRFLKTACRPARAQVCMQVDLCRDDVEARCVDRRCVAVAKR